MNKIMQPIPFQQLLNWIVEEHQSETTIFGIPEEKFYYKKSDKAIQVLGGLCETPLGPASGPHTQLAQNLVSAYLTGGRFFELKTVTITNDLDLEKPCIDAEQEAYNTEWSSELGITRAYEEYVKAWFLIHLLEEMFGFSTSNERAFVFNMSVGYDLEVIQSPKIDNFIESLKNASESEIFQKCQTILKAAVDGERIPGLSNTDFVEEISSCVSHSVTLNGKSPQGTLPEDQEATCKYLMSVKGINTYIKLNPTLHGYEYVKDVFRKLGYDHIQFKEESFTQDVQYPGAVDMLRTLMGHAQQAGVEFGVKISNTLPVVNTRGTLPKDEMYMSGRALYPLAVNLAWKLSEEFKGKLPISYSGGADYFNMVDLLRSGLKPITMATYFLKPGGYARMTQLVRLLEGETEALELASVDLDVLARTAEDALRDPRYAFEGKPVEPMKIDQNLPLLDCFVAPCMEGCPIQQDVPEYIRLVGEERYAEAYRLIISKNPLPFITGYICDHKCQLKCVRNDYEDPVLIRDLKHIAAENGFEEVIDDIAPPERRWEKKVAVIGAGPAGLSAGYFLSIEGFDVTVFDKTDHPGGMVAHGIPDFRYPEGTVEKDLKLIRRVGVSFELNCDPALDVNQLKEEGFHYIVLAIGAWESRKLKLEGDQEKVRGAIDFLHEFKENPGSLQLGKHVAVIGGGNSAMDSARAAKRVSGVEDVSILYRRTVKQMSADREELENAMDDGVIFEELVSPVSLHGDTLTCQRMRLGEKDASGRRRPIPVESEFEEYEVDTVLAAIRELVDYDLLRDNGIEIDEQGNILVDEYNETSVEDVFIAGDAYRGPATVVEGVADARNVADGILRKERVEERRLTVPEFRFEEEARLEEVQDRKAVIAPQISPDAFEENYLSEAERCLECILLCNKCVEVCPNRANVAIAVTNGGMENHNQILHLDALCNECGNCETFCPYHGAPYKDKFTLFWDEKSFLDSDNQGCLPLSDATMQMRYKGEIYQLSVSDSDGRVMSEDPSLKGDKEVEGLFELILTVRDRYPYLLRS